MPGARRRAAPGRNWRERVDPEFRDLLPSFEKAWQSESARLHTLLSDADFGELARIGHNFKGAAGYFGLNELEKKTGPGFGTPFQSRDESSVATTIERWRAFLLQSELAMKN